MIFHWRFSGAHCFERQGEGTLAEAREAWRDVDNSCDTQWVEGYVRDENGVEVDHFEED